MKKYSVIVTVPDQCGAIIKKRDTSRYVFAVWAQKRLRWAYPKQLVTIIDNERRRTL